MPQLQIPAVEPADALSNLERSESSVSPAVLDRARKLLDALHRLGAPTPFILPTEFGGIQFEWRGGRFELGLPPRQLQILKLVARFCKRTSDLGH